MPADLVAVSHGTDDPRGRAAVAALVAAIAAAAPELTVVGAKVDVEPPTPQEAMAALEPGSARVLVPLLLSTGFHTRVDLARAARDGAAVVAAPLGPDPRLADVLVARLGPLGADDAVVLVAAGTSEPAGAEACRTMAALLAERLGRPVETAFLTATEPRAHAVVGRLRAEGRRIAVASYLLAPGVFQAKAETLGADRASPPVLLPDDVPPAVVDIALDRYRAATGFASLPMPPISTSTR